MVTPYQTYNNQVGVLLSFVVSDPDIACPFSLSLASYGAIKMRCKRNEGLRLRKAGGQGNEALLAWDKLPRDWTSELIKHFGDPKEKADNTILQFVITDQEAEKTFAKYELEPGKFLPVNTQNQYVKNASILNAINKIFTDQAIARKPFNKSMRNFWPQMSLAVNHVRERHGHTLPTSHTQLKRVYDSYQKDSYESLISKKFCNKNTEKITPEIEAWIVVEMATSRQSIDMIYMKYKSVAKQHGWRQDIDVAAFRHRVSMPEVQQMINLRRVGGKSFRKMYGYTFKLRQPLFSNDLWVGDGTAINWYYFNTTENKVMMASTYAVMDSKSRKFLGWTTSEHMLKETFTMQTTAYRMAVRVAQAKPYQILYDNQGGHKTAEAQDFYSRLASVHFPSKAYRPSGKPIEQAFGDFQRLILSKYPFWSGFGRDTHANPLHKPNMDAINKHKEDLPNYNELKMLIEKAFNDWNDLSISGRKSPNEIYAENFDPEGCIITLDQMADLFFNMQGPKKYQSDGITLRLNKEDKLYEVYDENGDVDFRFRTKHLKENFYLKYDPEGEYEEIELYQKHPTGGFQKVATASPKRLIDRSAKYINSDDLKWTHKQLKGEAEMMDELESKTTEYGYSEDIAFTAWRKDIEETKPVMMDDDDDDQDDEALERKILSRI